MRLNTTLAIGEGPKKRVSREGWAALAVLGLSGACGSSRPPAAESVSVLVLETGASRTDEPPAGDRQRAPDVAPDRIRDSTQASSATGSIEEQLGLLAVPISFRLDAFHPAVRLDYISVREVGPDSVKKVLEETGAPCAVAHLPSACLAKLEELERNAAQMVPKRGHTSMVYVVTVQGDQPRLWRTENELKTLLGPIDTLAEAWFWLFLKKRVEPYCGIQLPGCEARVGDEFELRARKEYRCGVYVFTDSVYRVSASGAIRLMRRRGEKRGAGQCAIP